jgi:hypothetical protein
VSKAIWAGIVILVALIAGRIAIGVSHPPSDRQQIEDALQKSIQASKEGRPGGVMDLLGDNLSYNGQNASQDLGQVARFIKNQKPDITVEKPDPIITGDEAQVVSPVDITVSFLGQQKSFNLKDVILVFRREPSRQFLVFPSTRWQLIEVRAQAPASLDLAG